MTGPQVRSGTLPVTRCPRGHFTNPKLIRECAGCGKPVGSCRCEMDYHAATHIPRGRRPRRRDERLHL